MLQLPTSPAGWVAFFGQAEVPVLKHTAQELDRLRADRRQVNASSIASVVTDDPLMTVKLLHYMHLHKPRHQVQELLDVKQALLMMGIDTFFREVPAAPSVEDMFHDHPDARTYLLNTVRRAQSSAYYAADWAQRLHDMHAEEVKVSALLTHVTEMLMWCFNPVQMIDIRRRQAIDRTRRSADVQREVLGFSGLDLQRQLTVDWQLPELMMSLLDPGQAQSPRVRNVMLAVRLARHAANGWRDAALPDDYRDIAALLHMEPGRVMSLARSAPSFERH